MPLVSLLAMLLPVPPTLPAPIPPSNIPDVSRADRLHCVRAGARRVGNLTPPAARKLNEMPSAKPIYTVVREIDGCPIPVSVR